MRENIALREDREAGRIQEELGEGNVIKIYRMIFFFKKNFKERILEKQPTNQPDKHLTDLLASGDKILSL